MKLSKQINTIKCLECGKYKVVNDKVYCYHKGKQDWNELKYNILPSGYSQFTLFNSQRYGRGIKVTVYRHILIYLAQNGLYKEGWQIDHIDRDKSNCMPYNLVAKPAIDNISNSERPAGRRNYELRVIRSEEIEGIKSLMDKGLSQSAIARQLNLNRLSVRYTIKRIEAGIPLKYE